MTKRIDWLDSLRAVAIIGVVLIHTSTPTVNMAFGIDMFHWWVGNVFASATRFAVPLFLMISGAVLLSHEYDVKTFYKKRYTRILYPFLFWAVAYFVFRYFTFSGNQPTGIKDILNWSFKLFLNEGISKHFWYVYMVLFLYIITPIMGAYVRKLKPGMLIFLLAAWVLVCSILKDMNINMYAWNVNLFPKFINYAIYSGYMVLGYYLYNFVYVSRNIRLSAWILYLVTVIIAACMVYISSKTAGKLNLSIYHYYSLNSIIQSVAIFIAFKETQIPNKTLAAARNVISDYSYGIYLIHIMILGLLYRQGISWRLTSPIVSIPLVVLLTILISMAIIFLLRKIPKGKNISG